MINRYTLGVIAVLAFAGCGGAGTTVQLSATTQSRAHQASSAYGDLLYTSNGYIFTYPAGAYVGTFSVPGGTFPGGMCSDNDGNVFDVINKVGGGDSYVREYSHGGTAPIATLDFPGTMGNNIWEGCAYDSTRGNLAVTSDGDGSDPVAVFANEEGSPTYYTPSCDYGATSATFDGSGNLFINAPEDSTLCELPHGSGTFSVVTGPKRLRAWSLLWGGTNIAALSLGTSKRSQRVIYRLSIVGSRAKIVGTTTFSKMVKDTGRNFWIQDNTVVFPNGGKDIGIYAYPTGGSPETVLSGYGLDYLGLTVSVAPTGPRIHK
jgi:hypothetical protein